MSSRPQRIGLQAYTVEELAKRDLPATLRTVAGLGYEGVELAGLHGHPAGVIRRVLDDLSLTPIAAHVELEDLEVRRDETIGDLVELGCGAAIVAWLPPERYADEPTARRTIERMLEVGAVVRAAGLGFAYHNHAFEFAPLSDTTLWELICAAPAEELPLEIDVRWVRHAGLDPTHLIEGLGSRVVLVHAKDTAADGGDCPIGTGIERWPEVLSAVHAAGVEWVVVEQEDSSDILTDIATSIANLRRLLG